MMRDDDDDDDIDVGVSIGNEVCIRADYLPTGSAEISGPWLGCLANIVLF